MAGPNGMLGCSFAAHMHHIQGELSWNVLKMNLNFLVKNTEVVILLMLFLTWCLLILTFEDELVDA